MRSHRNSAIDSTHQRSRGMSAPWTAGDDHVIVSVSKIHRSLKPEPLESWVRLPPNMKSLS